MWSSRARSSHHPPPHASATPMFQPARLRTGKPALRSLIADLPIKISRREGHVSRKLLSMEKGCDGCAEERGPRHCEKQSPVALDFNAHLSHERPDGRVRRHQPQRIEPKTLRRGTPSSSASLDHDRAKRCSASRHAGSERNRIDGPRHFVGRRDASRPRNYGAQTTNSQPQTKPENFLGNLIIFNRHVVVARALP